MDNFKIIYRILKHLEQHLDERTLDTDKISHETLGISFLRWESLLRMMQEDGYIKGLVYEQTMSDSSPHVVMPIRPSITIKGLEYLEENSFMKKAASTLKTVKEIIPGIK
jgi:hypothetical protein